MPKVISLFKLEAKQIKIQSEHKSSQATKNVILCCTLSELKEYWLQLQLLAPTTSEKKEENWLNTAKQKDWTEEIIQKSWCSAHFPLG